MKVAARWPLPPRPAVFIDKDGTLVHDLPYNTDPARVHLTPHAVEGLSLLARSGFALFVVTNQQALATGRIRPNEYDALRAQVERLLRDQGGIALQGWYTCPHAPQITPDCGCRKPAPGLLRRAADEHGIDLERSWMVGDILDDIEAGRSAGCSTVLLDVGNETEWRVTPQREPHRYCPHLLAAAEAIVAEERSIEAAP